MLKLLKIVGFILLIFNTTNVFNNQYINQIYNLNKKKKIIISVPKIKQINPVYCGAAATLSLFNAFSINDPNITQNSIYHDLHRGEQPGIILNSIYANYLNNILSQYGIINYNYQSNLLLPGYGQTIEEQEFFQLYVSASLENNGPVVVSHSNTRYSAHIILINEIIIDSDNLEQTIYHYMDPADGSFHTINSSNLANLFPRGGHIVGNTPTIFNFKTKTILETVTPASYNGSIAKQSKVLHITSDISSDMGIFNWKLLKKFKLLTLKNYALKTSWFNFSHNFNFNETWNPIYFPNNTYTSWKTLSFLTWNDIFYCAHCNFLTEYQSETFTNAYNDFFLTLSYRFSANILLTTTQIIANIKLTSNLIWKF